MKTVYLVMIATGSHDDFYSAPMFATEKEQTAKEWVDRYNGIIEKRLPVIEESFGKVGWDDMPFLGEFIYYQRPHASFQEIQLR